MEKLNPLQHIFLQGTLKTSVLPESLEQLYQRYQSEVEPNDMDDEENIAQKVLTLASIQSLQNKIAYQYKAISPFQKNKKESLQDLPKKQALDQKTEYTLHLIFKNRDEDVIGDFIKNFDAQTWQFPDFLLPQLLNYGMKKRRFVKELIQLVGPKGLWLAQHNPQWAYLLEAHDCQQTIAENISTPPKEKPINENVLTYVQEHIHYTAIKPETQESHWIFTVPNQMTAQLKACGIKNNLYQKYNLDGNQNSYALQLIQQVNPLHWIGEDCPDKVSAYVKMLESFHHETRYKEKMLFLAFQKAATLYQDRDLIIAQHIHLSKRSSLWYEEVENILGKDNSNLFNDQDKEMISAYYIDNILNDTKHLPENHPFIYFLTHWESWTENVTVLSVRKLAKLYKKYAYFNYALLALIKRAAYSIPAHLHSTIEDIWRQHNKTVPHAIEESLNIIKQRHQLSKYYK